MEFTCEDEQDLLSAAREYLGDAVTLDIENRGETAFVDSFEILEKYVDNLLLLAWKGYPIEKGRVVRVRAHGGRIHWNQLSFKFALNYYDAGGYKYQDIFQFAAGRSAIIESKELGT